MRARNHWKDFAEGDSRKGFAGEGSRKWFAGEGSRKGFAVEGSRKGFAGEGSRKWVGSPTAGVLEESDFRIAPEVKVSGG
jgi:hypothetical protein